MKDVGGVGISNVIAKQNGVGTIDGGQFKKMLRMRQLCKFTVDSRKKTQY